METVGLKHASRNLCTHTKSIMKKLERLLISAQDAAAFLAAKFFTRPEIVGRHLPAFVEFCKATVQDASADDFLQMGCLKAVAAIYKMGKREDLLQFTPGLLSMVVGQGYKDNRSALLRKLSLKLIQRLGLNFLKTKVAPWRYQRGSRSLTMNLKLEAKGEAEDTKRAKVESAAEDEDEEDYDVPEEIEDVIEQLLVGLRDRDTLVRWSAAKGVGRVTNRLPKELADDVVGSLLQLFSFRETDSAWHGGCLAIAELGRRGLLLPARLPEVVQVRRQDASNIPIEIVQSAILFHRRCSSRRWSTTSERGVTRWALISATPPATSAGRWRAPSILR